MKGKKIWSIIVVIFLWVFLFQSIDLAGAKDPDYPTKSINFIIPFGAGGALDLTSRAFTNAAKKYMGQPFIPVNKPGAGGALGATMVMSARPDGYTLGAVPASVAFVTPFSEESPFKDLSGFTMIVNYGYNIYPWIVRSDAPWRNWKEFIEWAGKNPRAAKIGIAGARSTVTQGFAMWQVEKREQVEFTHVPFKSGAEILNAILGGHINVHATTLDVMTIPYLKEGKLQILTYSDPQKIPGYESIPSLQELYGISIPNLIGVFGPKGLPEYVLEKLEDTFAKAVNDPDFVSAMNQMYTPIVYMNRAKMNKYIDETFPKFGEIMKILKAEEAKEKK